MKSKICHWLRCSVAVLSAGFFAGSAGAQTIEMDKTSYQPGEPVAITFSDGPGNPKDWIGIYPYDQVPGGGTGATEWFYVDGTRDGTTGVPSGTLHFPTGLQGEGDWAAYLFENDTYTILASAVFTVLQTDPALTTDAPLYSLNEPVEITFRNGPANAKDWIGIYKEGETPGNDTPATLWFYVDGTRDGSVGLAEGTLTFSGGLASPGEYVAHFLSNDSYTTIATTSFSVSDAARPLVLPRHSAYFPDEPVIVDFANGPGNPRDWIGVYYADEIPDGDPTSLIWSYVGGSQTIGTGLESGSVSLPGIPFAGEYDAFLLEDDGYDVLDSSRFSVVDPGITLVRLNKRIFYTDEDITAEFFNGPGNAKDWLGIYRAGEVPDGDPSSVRYLYVDGTGSGSEPVSTGTVLFPGGLSEPGNYEIHLLENDGYTVLSTESFTVVEPAGSGVRVVSISPANNSEGLPPIVSFKAALTNEFAALDVESVELRLNGEIVEATITSFEEGAVIEYASNTLPAPGSAHTFTLTFSDDADPAVETVRETSFAIGTYRDIALPEPIYFNDFDSVTEGELPAGWTEVNFTASDNENLDLGDLNSASYRTWTVVDADRFTGSLLGYSTDLTDDYQRVLTPNPFNVLNGEVYDAPLGSGNMLFANSGYRNGQSQVMYLFTPDFDLSAHSDVHLSFHSLWEQNQDSIASLEYSIDQGQNWLPIAYLLDEGDVVRTGDAIDAMATLTEPRDDIATYIDPISGETLGSTYGFFIGAKVGADLAPFISPRIDNDPRGSKRIELYRLPEADNQATVRFRFAHAGTDSWYWGVDNFGLYSIPSAGEQPELNISRSESNEITVSWDPSLTGFTLQASATLGQGADWQPVSGSANNSVTLTAEGDARYFRLVK